jgi:hypothetical protein
MFAMAGPLPNRKHEIFAIELATGAPLESAYLAAGYKPGRAARFNASRLRNKPWLRARLNELFDAAAKDAVVGIGWVQRNLIAIIEGRAESKAGERDGKPFVERDRLAALVALLRSLGVNDGTTVSVSATAQAGSFAVDVTDEMRVAAIEAFLAKVKIKTELPRPADLAGFSQDELERGLAEIQEIVNGARQ